MRQATPVKLYRYEVRWPWQVKFQPISTPRPLADAKFGVDRLIKEAVEKGYWVEYRLVPAD